MDPALHRDSPAAQGALELTNLKTLDIPSTVVNINDDACSGCTALTTVTVSGGDPAIAIIGNRAFEGCSSLSEFPADQNLTSIGERAFAGCTSLTGLNAGSRLNWIGGHAFDGSGIQSFDLTGAQYLYLAPYAFANATELQTVMFHENLQSLLIGTFQGCTSLTSANLAETKVGYVGGQAFEGCSSMTSVSLPATVSHIDAGAFANCNALESITLAGENPPSFADDAFPQSVMENATVNFPQTPTAIANYTNPYGSWYKFTSVSDQTTALTEIAAPQAEAFYDLQGRRADLSRPGLYLTPSGRKLLLR